MELCRYLSGMGAKQNKEKNMSETEVETEVKTEEEIEEARSAAAPEMIKLRARPVDEWLKRVNAITDEEIRGRVMCVVWWDFLGDERAGENKDIELARPKFGAGHKADEHAVIKSLKQLGYPDRLAEKRGREPKSYK